MNTSPLTGPVSNIIGILISWKELDCFFFFVFFMSCYKSVIVTWDINVVQHNTKMQGDFVALSSLSAAGKWGARLAMIVIPLKKPEKPGVFKM